MSDCRPDEHKNSIHIAMFNATGADGGLRRRKRGLETVFVDPEIKQRLVERFQWFGAAEDWHFCARHSVEARGRAFWAARHGQDQPDPRPCFGFWI
jgi:hypothetical protein